MIILSLWHAWFIDFQAYACLYFYEAILSECNQSSDTGIFVAVTVIPDIGKISSLIHPVSGGVGH
jgi:hypothetical protein